MSTRLQGWFVSQQERVRYDVYVDDGAPSTGAIEEILIKSFSIDNEFSEKDVDANLFLGKCKAVFVVENATQEAVFADMADAEETQFRIRVHKAGELHFVGFVQMELLTIQDTSGAYDYTVQATDGVARLKTVEYTGGGDFYDDYATIRDHLQGILSNVPLSDYYAVGEEYYRINANLWPEGLTPDDNTDPTALVRCSYRAFRTVDTQGAVKFSSVYDVLLELCRSQGWRFMYSRGRYVITDIVDYTRTSGPVTFIRYDIEGTELTADTLGSGNQWNDWIRRSGELSEWEAGTTSAVTRAGGKISFLPALQNVKWTYQHYSKQNSLPTQETWTHTSTPSVGIQNFRTAPGLRLRVSANTLIRLFNSDGNDPEVTVNTSFPQFAVVEMQLYVTDSEGNIRSYTRDYSISALGASYSNERWEDSDSVRSCPVVFRLGAFDEDVANSISLLTPEVPVSGMLTINFDIREVYFPNGDLSSATPIYTISNAFLTTFIEGSVTDQYNFSNFRANNEGFQSNSATLERTVRLGDGPDENTFGRMEYLDDNGDWQLTDGWRRFAGGIYRDDAAGLHGAVRARDTLALQDRTRQELNGTLLTRDYAPEFIYERAGKRYLPYKIAHNLVSDQVSGKFFEIAYALVIPTVPDPIPSDDNPIDQGGAGGIGPNTDGSSNDGTTGGLTGGGGEVPPGLLMPGITTVSSGLDGELPEGEEATVIPVQASPADLPLFEGDIIVITTPVSGQQETVTVTYDSELGIPAADQNGNTPGSFPYYTDDGVVWLIADDTSVAVEGFTPGSTMPENSFLQFNAAYLARLRALLRVDHIDADIYGFTTSLTTGFAEWFWRPTRRTGWHIRKVQFAFGQAGTGQAKVNLKYYDATGFRYTIATHDATAGLGTVVDAFATVQEGYYRVEVETLTGTPPKGLQVVIELIKIIPA